MAIIQHNFIILYPQVCPPGLHIDLGIFLRLYNLFEEQNDELDVEIMFQASKDDHQCDTAFSPKLEETLQSMREYHRMKAEAESAQQIAFSIYDNISTLLLGGCSLSPDFYLMAMSKADEYAKKSDAMARITFFLVISIL